MIIKNSRIFNKEGFFEEGNLEVQGEFIVSKTSENETVIDGQGLMAIPGLVDIHHHGSKGADLSDGTEASLDTMARYLAENGITAFCPTSMTFPEETLGKTYDMVREYKNKPDGAKCVGINMEGPFLSMAKKGAQNPKYLMDPDIEMFRRLNERSGGSIKLVTMAPEAPGSLEFIKAVSGETTVSIGHSASNYEQAKAAIDAGARHLTHIFNGMTPFLHRDPGIIGAASENPEVYAELICDGIHIHPSMVRAIFKLFDRDRVVLVSDNMMATGMPDGEYELGGQRVKVEGHSATLVEGNSLAGSATNQMDCLRKALEFGIPLETAIKAATIVPAKTIGIDNRHGALEAGYYADILLVDDTMTIQKIILRGQELKTANR